MISCSHLTLMTVILSTFLQCLTNFTTNKDAIIAGGFHHGQRGGVIDNWYILKIELMQSIVPSIQNSGVIMQ